LAVFNRQVTHLKLGLLPLLLLLWRLLLLLLACLEGI
jgi:hypothetical protein